MSTSTRQRLHLGDTGFVHETCGQHSALVSLTTHTLRAPHNACSVSPRHTSPDAAETFKTDHRASVMLTADTNDGGALTLIEIWSITAVTLFAKTFLTSLVQGVVRIRNNAYAKPEDAAFFGRGVATRDRDLPIVERAQSATQWLRRGIGRRPINLRICTGSTRILTEHDRKGSSPRYDPCRTPPSSIRSKAC